MNSDTTYSRAPLPGLSCVAAAVLVKPAIAVAGLIVVAKLKNTEPS